MVISKCETLGTAALAALCIVAVSACGSNSSSTKTAQSGDESASSAPGVTATAPTSGDETSATNLPIYPSATKQAVPAALGTTSHCGHTMKMTMYQTAADGQTVADWYKGRLPGASVIDMSGELGGGAAAGKNIAITILDANAAAGVTITQMQFNSSTFKNAAKTIGANKTGIGLETWDPPLGPDYVALVKQATGDDAAAKQAAKDKLKSMCGSANAQ